MGFFKKIGQSLKAVTKSISLKNVVKVATGNASEVGEEIKSRALKPFLPSNDDGKNLEKSLSNTDAAKTVSHFLTKAYLMTLWAKYKNWIIGVGVLIVGLVIWKFAKPKNKRARR